MQCLKTRYYLNETSIPLLSITLNNEDFTPHDSISGASSVSICSLEQINKYSLDQVICLVLLRRMEVLNDQVGVALGHLRPPLRPAAPEQSVQYAVIRLEESMNVPKMT